MKFLQLIIILTISIELNAQEIGNWETHSSMKKAQYSKVTADGIWAITDGGLFFYDFDEATYQRITKSDGLSSHNLTALEIDNYGKVWIGTLEGIINIYDPSTGQIKRLLEIYNSNKNRKRINFIEVNGDTIYAASDFGISLIHSVELQFLDTIVKFGEFPAESKINKIFFGRVIYVCSDEGLSMQKPGFQNLTDPGSWNSFIIGQGSNKISALNAVEFGNQIIIGTDRGIYRMQDDIVSQWQFNSVISDLKVINSEIYCSQKFTGQNGSILSSSITKLHESSFDEIYNETFTEFNQFDFDNSGRLIIASSSGLTLMTVESTDKIYPSGPYSNLFNSLDFDTNGNLWTASGRDVSGVGFYKYDGNEWTNYNTSNLDLLNNNAYHIVSAQANGDVYFCNWGDGVLRMRNNEFTNFNPNNSELPGIPNDPNYSVITGAVNDSKNNTWFLNFMPLNRNVLSVLTNGNKWHHFSFSSPYIGLGNTAQYLAIDQYGRKWFAVTTGDPGLYYFDDNGTLENTSDDVRGVIKVEDGLRNNNVSAIAIDLRGELWIGTSLGITIIPNPKSPKSNIISAEAFAIKQQAITAIAVDPINRKWVGTREGLFLLTSDGSRVIESLTETNSPLPANEIKSIAIDNKNGIVYVGTDFGLTSFHTSAVEPVESFNELFTYPNPFIIGNGGEILQIDGLIKDTSIKIISASGQLVSEFESPGGRMASWNGRDLKGELVASGVYIIVAYDLEANNVAHGKVAVIRE